MKPFKDTTYRGYRIRYNELNGLCWIEKDGGFICYSTGLNAAKLTIDDLFAGSSWDASA